MVFLIFPVALFFFASEGRASASFLCRDLFQNSWYQTYGPHESWPISQIHPRLRRIHEQFKIDSYSARGELELLLSHRLFYSFSFDYIQTIGKILRDLFIKKRSDASFSIEESTQYLVSILSAISLKYQAHELEIENISSEEDWVAYHLLSSISKMLQSTTEDYARTMPRRDADLLARADRKTGLIILSQIKHFNQISAYYFMGRKSPLLNMLLSDGGLSQDRELILSAVKNICGQDSEHISFAISQLVKKSWRMDQEQFQQVIKILYSSIGPNFSIQVGTKNTIMEINDLISQKMNAPVRDLEMNVINILSNLMLHRSQVDSFTKAVFLLKLILERPISLSDRNMGLLAQSLAQAAVRSLSPEEEVHVEEILKRYSQQRPDGFDLFHVYLQKKDEASSQKSDFSWENTSEDGVILF